LTPSYCVFPSNAQAQFGANSFGIVDGGNGGRGGDVMKRFNRLDDGSLDTIDTSILTGGNGGSGSVQIQAGPNSVIQNQGGNGGSGGSV
jgi:hypothetical protein